uniref:UBC core domain-containing protein n=1 Tax=Setaria digitata TaxID=48799 RepID=A0A915PXX3_9BILA
MSRRNSLFRSTGSRFRDAEGVEIATEMTPGEPLRFSAELITEHSIMSEYAMICRDPIDGLYAVPSARNKFEWFGLLFIRRGVYAGAVFRFTLHLPMDFPSTELPRVVFDLDVFHPHVNPATRELDLKRYFVDGWKSDQHHIYHILLIRTFFTFDSNPATCVNIEAATLLRDNRELFRIRAGELIRESRSVIYDPAVEDDVNAIRLMPWDASIHEPLRQRLIGGLTDSQISTMSMLGSLGCGLNRSSVFECRGKYGFSWISPTDLCYMVEPPRPAELDLKTISEAGKCPKNAGPSHGARPGIFNDQSVSDNFISQIYELNLNDASCCVQKNEKESQESEKNDLVLLKSNQQNEGAVEDFGTKNNKRISGLVEKVHGEWGNEGQETDMNAFSKPENSARSGSEYVKAHQDDNVPSIFQPRSSWDSDEIGESDI